MLENATEGDDLTAAFVDAVADNLVYRVEGRGDIGQRTVGIGLLHAQFHDIEAVVDLEVAADVAHVEGIEAGLRVAQCRLHLRGLQHLLGMIGRDAQRLSAVDDILAQSQSQRGDTLLGGLVADGVVVQRTEHARERGIIAVTILTADDLLQDDGHLLLVDDVLRGYHICLRVLVVHRGVDALDGTGQHAQHLILVVQIGYHIRTVDAGEGLVVAVLQERTGTDGNRRLDSIEEGEEVGYQRVGKLRTEEVLQDFLVGGIAQGYGVEVVLLHKLVEEVGTEHDGLRYRHLGTLVLVQLGVALDDAVEEGQAAALAAERAFADAGEVGITVELQAVEDGHHADVLHAAVLHDGVEDNLAVGVNVLQLMPRDVFQEG